MDKTGGCSLAAFYY